jgi:hypothetical protein
MKIILSIFLFLFIGLSTNISAQKIGLINTKFKDPILYTDSLTTNQLYGGYFPFLVSEIDSLYSALEYFKELVSKRQRIKMQYFEFRFNGCVIKTERIPMGYGDRYKIQLTNTIGDNTATYELGNGKITNLILLGRLNNFIEYLKNEKTITLKPYTKAPRIYNIVVVTDRY